MNGRTVAVAAGMVLITGGGIALGMAVAAQRPGRPTWASEPLVVIEVQHGGYFGEDDIIPVSDDYGRGE